MLLQEVIIENFLSIAKATIPMAPNGLVLVTGWNEMLGRANGAGKSAIMLSISWCLYGEFPRDIKVDEIVRRGESSCSVTVKAILNGQEWIITRKRPVDLQITVAGKKLKGNPKLLQATIEQEIGFNYRQFLVTSYFPQKGDGSRFINQKDSLAKEFLGVVLNFSRAEQGYKKLHLQLKDKELELSSAVAKMNGLSSSLSRLKSIADVPFPELPGKQEVASVKSELDILKAQTINPPDTSAIDAQIDSLKKKQKALEQVQYQVATLKQKVKTYTSNIEDLDEPQYMSCPNCGEHLIERNDGGPGTLVVFDDESAANVKKNKEDQLKLQIDETNSKISELELVISKNNDLSAQVDSFVEKRSLMKSDFLVAEQKKKTLEIQLQSFRRAYEMYQQAKDQAAKIQSQISETEAQLNEATVEVQQKEKEVMELVAAKQVLSPTGAIAYSLDSIIDEINGEVTSYLDIFSHGTMTYRMASGEDKAKVTHNVTYEGKDVSVGSLSGGEERGLVISVDLGLSEVLAKRCGVPLPSVLMLDECFEGLDYVGKEKVLDALKEIARDRCILVIDHHTEMAALFDSRIKVIKKDSISHVEIE